MQTIHGARVTALLALVLMMTILCGLGALLTAREMERLMGAMVSRNLPSVVAAAELEDALQAQRGLVAAFMLDGGQPGWISDLDRIKPSLAHWLGEARRTARSAEERRILDLLAQVYATYDAERERAIALFQAGHTQEARGILLRDVSILSDQAHSLCRQLITANERAMNVALQESHQRVESLTLVLAAGVGMALLLGLTLLVILSRRVFLPVRRLARDARAFSRESSATVPGTFPDELHELEFFSRALMSDMTQTRTNLEESQRRLLTAEKLAAVGKFAACAAHEIRSPLASMKMWLYELKRSAGSRPEIQRTCLVLEEEVGRLENLATSFLQFSRPPSLQLERASMSTIIDGTLELAGPRLQEKGLRVVRVNGQMLPPIMGDAHQLRQVLLNLIANAAEATPEGGEVRITETGELDADGHPDVVVRIQDAGPGVPAEVRARLFEPFTTTKPNGTGLGLCVAASIVAHHRGRLALEPCAERGAVFAVRIPACQD
jgi:signal transduction histidine kinase